MAIIQAWHKSTFSETANCVEVQIEPDVVRVRNTRDRGGAALEFTPAEWRAFVAGVRAGEFDLETSFDPGPDHDAVTQQVRVQ